MIKFTNLTPEIITIDNKDIDCSKIIGYSFDDENLSLIVSFIFNISDIFLFGSKEELIASVDKLEQGIYYASLMGDYDYE